MKFAGKTVLICTLIAGLLWGAGIIAQRRQLSDGVIRLHVVAHSDSPEDQTIKLHVRDAVTGFLREAMDGSKDKEQAKAHLQQVIPEIEALANKTLEEQGCGDKAVVSLKREEFGTREYDTFTMPAGVYDSLRIVIGEGEGKNWWCVVFPELCVPATTRGFGEKAVECGYSDSLTAALTGEKGYEVRFFLLDCIGKLENFFFAG